MKLWTLTPGKRRKSSCADVFPDGASPFAVAGSVELVSFVSAEGRNLAFPNFILDHGRRFLAGARNDTHKQQRFRLFLEPISKLNLALLRDRSTRRNY